MKTLDVVITALTICKNPDINRNCKDCPMPDTQECMGILMNDALHYLKMYRSDKLQWEADKKAYEDERQKAIHATKKARERYIALAKDTKDELAVLRDYWAEQQENRSLTWDELMTMVGKPVWVEVLRDNGHHYKWEGQWMLVKEFTQGMYGKYCHMEPNYRTWINTTYGDLWRAYRKENK